MHDLTLFDIKYRFKSMRYQKLNNYSLSMFDSTNKGHIVN